MNTCTTASSSINPCPWEQPQLKPNGLELLEKLSAVKHRLKTDAASEKDLIAKLDVLLELGYLDELRDGGEDRWIVEGMKLTRYQKRAWQYSDQTAKLELELKQCRAAEQANGDATCAITDTWRATLS